MRTPPMSGLTSNHKLPHGCLNKCRALGSDLKQCAASDTIGSGFNFSETVAFLEINVHIFPEFLNE